VRRHANGVKDKLLFLFFVIPQQHPHTGTMAKAMSSPTKAATVTSKTKSKWYAFI
jgi:hypothetical protein